MLYIAIVDDEMDICVQIEQFVHRYAKEKKVDIETDVCSSGEELIKLLDGGNSYQLILLDIELAELNGVAVGKLIREKYNDYSTQIAYVSGKTHYAMELFQVSPIDFLEKPVDYVSIEGLFNKLSKIIGCFSERFSYKYKHDTYHVMLKDILYFQSDDRKIKIATIDGVYEFYGKLDNVYEQLQNYNFIRIHKSYIVNIDRVKAFHYQFVIMTDEQSIPISQSKRSEVRKLQMKIEKESLK